MCGARRLFSREKHVFQVGFSLKIPRFLRKSKNKLNTSLGNYRNSAYDAKYLAQKNDFDVLVNKIMLAVSIYF